MPTARTYRGDSVPVAKVMNITPISVVAGQVFTVWCNGKPASYVAVSGDAPANVATGLAAAIQAAGAISEFSEMLASPNGSVLSLVAATAGIPFDVTVTSSGNVTVTETTAGQGATNERHQIALLGTYTAGTFTITYNFGSGNVTTSAIAYNASAATVQAALVALSGVGSGQVVVTGGPGPSSPWFVTFTGTLAGTAIAVGTIDGTSLTGNGSVTITETQIGNGLSNCVQSVNVSNRSSGSYTLTLDGQTTASIAYNATPAAVQTALQNLANVGSGNVAVYGIGGGSGANQNLDYYWIVFKGTLAGVAVSKLVSSYGTGVDILQAGGQTSADEFQMIDLGGATGGTFSITFQGVNNYYNPIGVDPAVGGGWAAVRNAIQSDAGWTIAGTTVAVYGATTPSLTNEFGGHPETNFLVHFQNAEANTQFPLLVIVGTGLTGGSGATVTRLATGKASVPEIQTITVRGASGNFKLSLGAQTTSNIAYNASAGTVQTRIQTDLSTTITACTVTGSGTAGSPYIVTVTTPANTAVAVMTADASGLGGGGLISELTHGTSGINEVQTVTLASGVNAGTFTLQFQGPVTDQLSYNASAAQVQAALRAIPTINTVSVTGSAGGPWTVTWSGGQAAAQQPLLFGDGSQLTGATTSLITLVTATPSSGPLHWDDPNNWLPAGVPNSGEDIYFAQGTANCLYGLQQIATFTANTGTNLCTWTGASDMQGGQIVYLTTTNTLPGGLSLATPYYLVNVDHDAKTFQLSTAFGGAPVTLTTTGTGTHTSGVRLDYLEFNARWTGSLGLPFQTSSNYIEYRPRYLHIGLLASGTQQIVVGSGTDSGSPKIQLDTDVDRMDLKEVLSGGSTDLGIPAVVWKGQHAGNTVNVISGDFGSALFAGETATLAALTQRGGTIQFGTGVTLTGPIDKTGGQFTANKAAINGVCTLQ